MSHLALGILVEVEAKFIRGGCKSETKETATQQPGALSSAVILTMPL